MTAAILYIGLGTILGFGLSIAIVLPWYKRHAQAIRESLEGE